MAEKPTYEELEQRVQELEKKNIKFKQVEKALQESEKKHRHMVESTVDLIWSVDIKGIHTFTNKLIEQHLGYKVEESTGSDAFQLMHPDDKDSIQKIFQKSVDQKKGWSDLVIRWIHKDGSIRYFESSAHPVFDVDDNLIGFNGIDRDITDRRQAEKALKHSQFQLGTVFYNLNSSIYIADMKSYEILFMNDHMKDLFGSDLTGSICWKAFHKKFKEPCKFCTNDKLIDADGNPTEPHIWEFYNKKIGRWYEIHDQAVPWIDGHLVRMEIAIDITDRKRMEQALLGSHEKLEQRVEERTSELGELNTALKVLLKNRENDKENIEESLLANFKLRLSPTINRLKKNLTPKQRLSILTLLESELGDIISPFSKRLSDPMISLTPMETQIASMIKSGKPNKEISIILNRSVNTISNHRKNIRKKLSLQNKNINLRTFLSTF